MHSTCILGNNWLLVFLAVCVSVLQVLRLSPAEVAGENSPIYSPHTKQRSQPIREQQLQSLRLRNRGRIFLLICLRGFHEFFYGFSWFSKRDPLQPGLMENPRDLVSSTVVSSAGTRVPVLCWGCWRCERLQQSGCWQRCQNGIPSKIFAIKVPLLFHESRSLS